MPRARRPRLRGPRTTPAPAPTSLSGRGRAALLAAATFLCLVPFIGKPFHVDDPLFVWTAQQIAAHPGNPYGFDVLWYTSPMPMWSVTKNPPLAAYFASVAGSVFGWSEQALHVAFMVPAIAAILGTYRLARQF